MKKALIILIATTVLGTVIHAQLFDRNVYPKPALPTLPAAGGTYVEPTFGTHILRVTDPNTQPGVTTSYRTPSETLTREWSADGRRLYAVLTGGGVQSFSFDPNAFTVSPTIQLSFDSEPEWSLNDPLVLIGRSTRNTDEACIKRYNFGSGLYDIIVGVRDLVPNVDANGRTYLRGYNTGGNPEMLSFIFGGLGQDNDHYIAYGPLNGPFHLLDSVAGTLDGQAIQGAPFSWGFYLHANSEDVSGRYVVFGPVNSQPYNSIIWDTTLNTFTPITNHGEGHGALGSGVAFNMPDDNDGSQALYRTLANPNAYRELVQPYATPSDFNAESHMSYPAGQDPSVLQVMASTYRLGNPDVVRVWDSEIDLIGWGQTTGGGPYPTVTERFAHHFSDVRNDNFPLTNLCFWATPRVNVSKDGRFAAFTSNMEKTLGPDPGDASEGCAFRQDVWIVRLF